MHGLLKTIGGVLERTPTIAKAVKSAAILTPGFAAVVLAVELGWLPEDLSPTSVAALTAAATWIVNTIKLVVARRVGIRRGE